MAYRELTRCVHPDAFVDLGANFNGWRRLGFTGLAEFILLVPLALFAGTLPVLIALLIQIIIFLKWWLYGRLICLGSGEDVCLIGAVKKKRKPAPKKKGGDDDATMDVYLADGPVTSQVNGVFRPKEDFFNGPQGHLLKHQTSVTNIGRGYAEDEGHYDRFSALHCEFEGEGMRNLLAWADATLLLLLAALVLPPPFSYIVLALAALISLFAGLNNWLDLGPLDLGEDGDDNPNTGVLKNGDVIMMKGRWIYDSLHDGWNEIHAIHHCQIIGRMSVEVDGRSSALLSTTSPENVTPSSSENLTNAEIWGTVTGSPPLHGNNLDNMIKQWCSAATEADKAEKEGSRDDPKNDWFIHPLVDGCSEPVVIL